MSQNSLRLRIKGESLVDKLTDGKEYCPILILFESYLLNKNPVRSLR